MWRTVIKIFKYDMNIMLQLLYERDWQVND